MKRTLRLYAVAGVGPEDTGQSHNSVTASYMDVVNCLHSLHLTLPICDIVTNTYLSLPQSSYHLSDRVLGAPFVLILGLPWFLTLSS